MKWSPRGEAVLAYKLSLLPDEIEDMVESSCPKQTDSQNNLSSSFSPIRPLRQKSSLPSLPSSLPSSITSFPSCPPPSMAIRPSSLYRTSNRRQSRNLCIRIIIVSGIMAMALRTKTTKDQFQLQLDRTRGENQELMRVRLNKKKVDLGTRLEKKDVHNILNSLLQGQVIEEDLFNQFWKYYFRQTATLLDVLNAYNATLLMLIEKIARNNHRVAELTKERQRLKQSHDFKNVNMVTLDLEMMESENEQFKEDLKELSKPFQLNFPPLIESLVSLLSKNTTKTPLDQSRQLTSLSQTFPEGANNFLDFMVGATVPEVQEDPSEDLQLTSEQKYHRFAIYVSCIALVIDLSMVFNKYNFLDLALGLFFVGNSLQERYLLQGDVMNRIAEKVELNFIEDKLLVRDAYTAEDIRQAARHPEDTHSYENYANSSFLPMAVTVLWDLLWLLVLNGSYYECEGKGFTVQGGSCAFWRYNRYILYASIYTLLSKAVILIFLTQIATLSVVRVFSKHNLSFMIFRFTDMAEALNWLVYTK